MTPAIGGLSEDNGMGGQQGKKGEGKGGVTSRPRQRVKYGQGQCENQSKGCSWRQTIKATPAGIRQSANKAGSLSYGGRGIVTGLLREKWAKEQQRGKGEGRRDR